MKRKKVTNEKTKKQKNLKLHSIHNSSLESAGKPSQIHFWWTVALKKRQEQVHLTKGGPEPAHFCCVSYSRDKL